MGRDEDRMARYGRQRKTGDLTRKIGFEQSTRRRPGVFNREYDDPMLCNQYLGSS